MAFTMMADIDETRMEKEIRTLAGKFFPLNGAKVDTVFGSTAGTKGQTVETARFDRTVDKRNHEVNAVIGGAAPSLYGGQDRIAAVLLANILGGPASNSILNNVLRERNGWVYGVECGYTQYSDTGIMAISLGCDKDNLEKCFKAISKAIRELQDKPLSDRKLKAAKKQLLGQLAISSESGEAQCLSMGKSLLAFGRVASSAENKAAIEAVTSADLQSLARRIFSPDNLSRLVYL